VIITFLDVESTSTKFDLNNLKKSDRVIELAMLSYNLDTRELVESFEERFYVDKTIAAQAELVHGISERDLLGKGRFAAFEPEITRILNKTDVLVGHNLVDFDINFMLVEYAICGKKIPDKFKLFDTIDSRWATSFGKLPSLAELCWATGVKYDPALAHSALFDIEVLAQCFFIGLDNEVYKV